MLASTKLSFAVGLVLVLARSAAAQEAWVDDKGSVNLSFTYNYAWSDSTFDKIGGPGDEQDPIENHTVVLGANYVPIDKLNLSLEIPMTSGRYTGTPFPVGTYPRHGRYDDGEFHTALTDLRFLVGYQLLEGTVALTPYIGVVWPLTDYETVGYAAAGRGLRQIPIGIAAGTLLGNFFLHGVYEFTLSEKYDTGFDQSEVGQNRSDFGLLAGYFFTDRLQVHLTGNLRLPHGGIDFGDARDAEESRVFFVYHDPLLAELFLMAGGGVGYQLTEKLEVNAFVRWFILGKNTRNQETIGLGLSWALL